jgi:hypothetical protein
MIIALKYHTWKEDSPEALYEQIGKAIAYFQGRRKLKFESMQIGLLNEDFINNKTTLKLTFKR